jgi:hypothetical protein
MAEITKAMLENEMKYKREVGYKKIARFVALMQREGWEITLSPATVTENWPEGNRIHFVARHQSEKDTEGAEIKPTPPSEQVSVPEVAVPPRKPRGRPPKVAAEPPKA